MKQFLKEAAITLFIVWGFAFLCLLIAGSGAPIEWEWVDKHPVWGAILLYGIMFGFPLFVLIVLVYLNEEKL